MAWSNPLPQGIGTNKHSSLWFHSFRFLQFIASGTVAGIVIFFTHHLHDGHIKMPWFFFFLQAAALTTICWLAISSPLLYWHRLSPLLNSIVNGFTGIIWIVAFSLLAWRMNSITLRGCTTELWGNNQGVLVCHLYKALFSAAIIAIVATICAFILDIRTLYPKDKRGSYRRAIAEQPGKEPLLHRDLPKSFAIEETHYLHPEATEQLYDPGLRTPTRPLRSLSPAPASSRGQSPEPLQVGRQARIV